MVKENTRVALIGASQRKLEEQQQFEDFLFREATHSTLDKLSEVDARQEQFQCQQTGFTEASGTHLPRHMRKPAVPRANCSNGFSNEWLGGGDPNIASPASHQQQNQKASQGSFVKGVPQLAGITPAKYQTMTTQKQNSDPSQSPNRNTNKSRTLNSDMSQVSSGKQKSVRRNHQKALSIAEQSPMSIKYTTPKQVTDTNEKIKVNKIATDRSGDSGYSSFNATNTFTSKKESITKNSPTNNTKPSIGFGKGAPPLAAPTESAMTPPPFEDKSNLESPQKQQDESENQ